MGVSEKNQFVSSRYGPEPYRLWREKQHERYKQFMKPVMIGIQTGQGDSVEWVCVCESVSAASRKTGVPASAISDICRGKNGRVRAYQWSNGYRVAFRFKFMDSKDGDRDA